MIMEITTLVGVPLLRGLLGWCEVSLKDKVITPLEWQKLSETILRIGVPAFALYYGFDLRPEISVILPVIADYIYQYIKKIVIKLKV